MIEELLQELDQAIREFNKQMPGIQNDIFDKVLEIAKDLDIKSGDIVASVKNLKTLSRIRAEIDKIIITPEYKKTVSAFAKSFNTIAKIQNNYFATLTEEFTAKAVLQEIKELAINDTITLLTEEGITANVSNKIYEVLSNNVRSGMSWKDFNKEIKNIIVGNDETAGLLEKYSSQITTDSINQFSANYSKIITDDLGLEWFVYAGALEEDSRDFCEALVAKKYVHESEIPELLKGHIGNKRVPIYKKTDLPYGMIPGTNADNFEIRRGGYRCQHQLVPVGESFVPKDIRDKINEE